MFDSFTYAVITSLIAIVSLIIFITLLINIIRHRRITLVSCFIFILTLVGMYLYIPFKFLIEGFENQEPEKLEIASKLSINPYEKRLCWNFMAHMYANDTSNKGFKNGKKAIEYMEKSIKGEYKKYHLETAMLGIWYSTKGDEEKVFELNKEVPNTIALRNIYILKDDYKNALKTFDKLNPSTMFYLKADLHRKLGEFDKAKEADKVAEEVFNTQIKAYPDDAAKEKYRKSMEKFKKVDVYKKWLLEKRTTDKYE